MPVFRNHTVAYVARNVKAFFNLEVGATRGEVSEPWRQAAEHGQEFQRLSRQLASKEAELKKVRAQLSERSADAVSAGTQPENIVWIFCTGRSGSTWLSNMMESLAGHEVWKEPKIGQLFGDFYFIHNVEKQRKAQKFILGQGREEIWLRSIRSMVLDGANGRFPGAKQGGYLVIKEPGGATGAPLVMKALPESRMILLVRDPRDVISSVLDGVRRGGWIHNWREEGDKNRDRLADDDPLAFTKGQALNYSRQIGNAKEAYDAHEGLKVLVRYEDLRADTMGTMRRIYSELGIDVDGEELTRVVEKYAWNNVPEEQKGGGKFYRKASPGGWQEDLTPEQAKVVEEATAPLLRTFYQ